MVPRRQHVAIDEWLRQAEGINQRSLVGLARAMGHLQPSVSPKALDTAILCMEWAVRNEMQKKFPGEVAALHSFFDQALLRTLAEYKGARLGHAGMVREVPARVALGLARACGPDCVPLL